MVFECQHARRSQTLERTFQYGTTVRRSRIARPLPDRPEANIHRKGRSCTEWGTWLDLVNLSITNYINTH